MELSPNHLGGICYALYSLYTKYFRFTRGFSEEYMYCAKTLLNWQTGILNSFDVPYSNGFTEGCNNKIKVLKRNAYGYRNFGRFRNRILHMFSYKNDLAKQGR